MAEHTAWDADNWQLQVEELWALSATMGDDFRLTWAAGSRQQALRQGEQEEQGEEEELDPESLQESGPPPDPSMLACDVALHVQVPPTGIQVLVVDRAPSQPEQLAAGQHQPSDPNAASTSSGLHPDNNGSNDSNAPHSGPRKENATSAVPSSAIPIGNPIRHLPPIRVHLTLPLDYPSASAPTARLHALWLEPDQATQLAKTLGTHYEAMGAGSAVLYDWLETLKEAALEEVGVAASGQLLVRDRVYDFGLHPPGQGAGQVAQVDGAGALGSCSAAASGGPADPAAPGEGQQEGGESGVSHTPPHAAPHAAAMAQALMQGMGEQPALEVALSILRCAATKEAEEFDVSVVHCAICFDEQVGAKCVRLGCGHAYCRQCFTQYAHTQVKEGAVENLRCPDPSCRTTVTPEVLRGVLSAEEFDRWEELLLQRTLDKMEDVVYCPRCSSIVLEDKDHCAQCTKCFFVFCSLCNEAWHPGEQCIPPEACLEVLQQRVQRRGPATGDRQRKEMDSINEMKSMLTVMGTSKKCPSCGMAITKTAGCNKMTCSYCSSLWCWKCGKEIEGYDHFRADTCALLDQEDIDRWNRAMEERGEGYDLRLREMQVNNNVVQNLRRQGGPGVQGPPIRFSRCVSCGQYNLKLGGNNLIRCAACNTAFCYLCRENLRMKPGLHFGPSKTCKQHTND